jgi:hypothetical protein
VARKSAIRNPQSAILQVFVCGIGNSQKRETRLLAPGAKLCDIFRLWICARGLPAQLRIFVRLAQQAITEVADGVRENH